MNMGWSEIMECVPVEKYLSIELITREMVLQFSNLYKPVNLKLVTKDYCQKSQSLVDVVQPNVTISLGKRDYEKEKHAESRLLSLEKFSENFIVPAARKLSSRLPNGAEILLSPMERPARIEAAWESRKDVGLRGVIMWDILTEEEILRFDVRALILTQKDKD